MVKVLMEVYIAEDKINKMKLKADSADRVFLNFKGKLLEKTKTEDSVFKASFNYYMDHPKEMELIYTALVDSLNLREQRSSFQPE